MCLSPDKMSVEQLEERIAYMREMIEDPNTARVYRDHYSSRIGDYEALLKEKANAGEMI